MGITTKRLYCADTFSYNSINKSVANRNNGNTLAACGYSYGQLARKEYAAFIFTSLDDNFYERNRIIGGRFCFTPFAYVPPEAFTYKPAWTCRSAAKVLAKGVEGNLDEYISGAMPFMTGKPVPMGMPRVVDITNIAYLKNAVSNGVFVEFNCVAPFETSVEIAGKQHAANPPYIEIDYEDGAEYPPTVRAIEPAFTIADGTREITVQWEYTHPYNIAQSHFSIEVQQPFESKWQSIANYMPGGQNQWQLAAGVFAAGQVKWRVKAWAAQKAASEWDEVPFIVKAAPALPEICELHAAPRPRFGWQAKQQEGWEAKVYETCASPVLVHESGVQFGSARSYTLPLFLPNGAYRLTLRVAGPHALWSQWADIDFEVFNPVREPFTLSAAVQQGDVHLAWPSLLSPEDGSKPAAIYIYRGEVCTAVLAGDSTAYSDPLAGGCEMYHIKAEWTDGSYTASHPVKVAVRIKYAMLAAVGADAAHSRTSEWFCLEKRIDAPPEKRTSCEAACHMIAFEGQDLPIAYAAGGRRVTHVLEFSCEEAKMPGALQQLVGSMVVYKDYTGACVYGVLCNLRSTSAGTHSFTLTIEETVKPEGEMLFA